MKIYRITSRKYKNKYEGLGGTKVLGRWHHEPIPILYASQATILCAAELIANSKRLPFVRYIQFFDIPGNNILDFRNVDGVRLSKDWKNDPMHKSCDELSKIWMYKTSKPALLIPSVLTPTEYNILLNPKFIKNEWIDAKPLLFHFDKRLSIPSKSKKDGNENDTKQRVMKLRKLWKL